MILILPFLIGQAVQGWTIDWLKERKSKVAWIDRIVIGTAVYVAFSGAVEQGLVQMFSGADWAAVIAVSAAFLIVALAACWALTLITPLCNEIAR